MIFARNMLVDDSNNVMFSVFFLGAHVFTSGYIGIHVFNITEQHSTHMQANEVCGVPSGLQFSGHRPTESLLALVESMRRRKLLSRPHENTGIKPSCDLTQRHYKPIFMMCFYVKLCLYNLNYD